MFHTTFSIDDFLAPSSSNAVIDPPAVNPLPDDPGPDMPDSPTPPPQIDDPEPPLINDPKPPETDWLADNGPI